MVRRSFWDDLHHKCCGYLAKEVDHVDGWGSCSPPSRGRRDPDREDKGVGDDDAEEGVGAEERLCDWARNYAGIEGVLRRHRSAMYQSTNVTPRSASPA